MTHDKKITYKVSNVMKFACFHLISLQQRSMGILKKEKMIPRTSKIMTVNKTYHKGILENQL